MSYKDYILNILSESYRKFRQDEHGKYIVYEDSEFAISVNDPNDATYIVLWHNEKDKLVNVGSMSVGKIRKGFEDFDIPTSEFLKINSIEINKKFRGLGYGTKMYKILQDYSKDSVKGIVSYLPDRINKKEIPKIYRKFKQFEDGDWHVILFDKKSDLTEAFGSELIDFSTDERFHNLIYGTPSEKEIKDFQRQLKIWQTDIYNPKIIRLYHGTSKRHDVLNQGLLRTATSRKKSYQSQPGFVYLSIFPNMAKQFAEMAYPQDDIIVYMVDLPIYKLLPDKDQLRNQRLFAGKTVSDNLADSIIHGHGVRVKGDIQNYDVKVYKEYPKN